MSTTKSDALHVRLRAAADDLHAYGGGLQQDHLDRIVAVLREADDAIFEHSKVSAWLPIASAPKDGTVILRPHRIWGAMDVRYAVDGMPGVLDKGIDWRWLNGDYTTAWTEEAFLPFWMPLPAPPSPPTEAAPRARNSQHVKIKHRVPSAAGSQCW